jgi:hypothetical protein
LGDDDNKRGILLFPRLCENVVLPIDSVVLNSNKLIWSVVVPRAFLKDVKYLSTGEVYVQLNKLCKDKLMTSLLSKTPAFSAAHP